MSLVCSVIYSIFPNCPNEISVCPITQFLFMSYSAHRYCLMLSSRREAIGRFEAFIQYYSREISQRCPLVIPKVHRARQQHSWDKTQPAPKSHAQLWLSLGEHCWVRWSCTDTYLPRCVCCWRNRASFTCVSLAARTAPGSSHLLCPHAPKDTSSQAPHYAGLLQHLSGLSFHFVAPRPVHLLHAESFGCFACNSPEPPVILAVSSCSVIHAELSSTPPSGNNWGFDPVGLFVCLNALMDQTLSCLLPNPSWLGILGCIFRNSLCTGKHSRPESHRRTLTCAFASILSVVFKPFCSL